MAKPAVLKSISHHTCPQSDGSKPHIGGPCISGASAVFFEDMPVCRVGDQLQCNSPSIDLIVSGSVSLFIEGIAAAIEGVSQTAHGGVVVKGGATSVFIGE